MVVSPKLYQQIEQLEDERNKDRVRYNEADRDLCMLCGAYGQDKRSLTMDCFVELKEFIPEFLDLYKVQNKKDGYYLRICKKCRGRLMDHLWEWAKECREKKNFPKDHDGLIIAQDGIPVEIEGVQTTVTKEQLKQLTKEGVNIQVGDISEDKKQELAKDFL